MAAPDFQFQVFPASGLPIYRQIMDQVRQQIAAGRLPIGGFLPSVRQVALDLQVNPMTISKAYSLLEREGVVELVRGQGMRVRGPNGTSKAANAPGTPIETLRQRRERLMPLLRQLVATAYQLALTPEQVRDLLDPLLEELERHEPPQPAPTRSR